MNKTSKNTKKLKINEKMPKHQNLKKNALNMCNNAYEKK